MKWTPRYKSWPEWQRTTKISRSGTLSILKNWKGRNQSQRADIHNKNRVLDILLVDQDRIKGFLLVEKGMVKIVLLVENGLVKGILQAADDLVKVVLPAENDLVKSILQLKIIFVYNVLPVENNLLSSFLQVQLIYQRTARNHLNTKNKVKILQSLKLQWLLTLQLMQKYTGVIRKCRIGPGPAAKVPNRVARHPAAKNPQVAHHLPVKHPDLLHLVQLQLLKNPQSQLFQDMTLFCQIHTPMLAKSKMI